MKKIRRASCTHTFTLEALRMIGAGQGMVAVPAILGHSTGRCNWIEAQQASRLLGQGVRVSPEQLKLARLRAELSKANMELALLKRSSSSLCEGVGIKYAWIDRKQLGWLVSMMCEQLDVSSTDMSGLSSAPGGLLQAQGA